MAISEQLKAIILSRTGSREAATEMESILSLVSTDSVEILRTVGGLGEDFETTSSLAAVPFAAEQEETGELVDGVFTADAAGKYKILASMNVLLKDRSTIVMRKNEDGDNPLATLITQSTDTFLVQTGLELTAVVDLEPGDEVALFAVSQASATVIRQSSKLFIEKVS